MTHTKRSREESPTPGRPPTGGPVLPLSLRRNIWDPRWVGGSRGPRIEPQTEGKKVITGLNLEDVQPEWGHTGLIKKVTPSLYKNK